VLIVAVLIAGCGKGGDEPDRQQTAAEEIRRRETAGPPLSDEVMDSLRTLAVRYNVTREEYWEGKGGVLGNEILEVWYPPGKTTVTHGMHTLAEMMKARDKTRRYFGQAPDESLKVVCAMSMASYREKTGREWWVYGKVDNNEIYLQPIEVLYQRTLLDIAISRCYFEWAVGRLSGDRAPAWLRHGLASLLSDEDWVLENQLNEFPDERINMTLADVESGLHNFVDKKSYRVALYNAFRMTRTLAAGSAREKLLETIRMMGTGADAAAAFEDVYGSTYGDLTAGALDFKVNR
jgi:hypothetical protein